jgi:hypothetical protein
MYIDLVQVQLLINLINPHSFTIIFLVHSFVDSLSSGIPVKERGEARYPPARLSKFPQFASALLVVGFQCML